MNRYKAESFKKIVHAKSCRDAAEQFAEMAAKRLGKTATVHCMGGPNIEVPKSTWSIAICHKTRQETKMIDFAFFMERLN